MSLEVTIMPIGLGLESAGAGLVTDPESYGCRSGATGVFEVYMNLSTGLEIARHGDGERGAADRNASERAPFTVAVIVVLSRAVVVTVVLSRAVVMVFVLSRAVVVVFVARFAVIMSIVGRVG